MQKLTQKDKSTFHHKRQLRLTMLGRIKNPIVMETHGGIGKLFASCYSTLPTGIVFEHNEAKSNFLAQQRPTWAVYRCDVVKALQAGAGAHLPVNFLDLDPYGSPYETVDAFFSSARPFPETMAIVVNDGLRQNVQMRRAWASKTMQTMVAKYGNEMIFKRYKEICREMLAERVSRQGYSITSWAAYYCGAHSSMTHWAAILTKHKEPAAIAA